MSIRIKKLEAAFRDRSPTQSLPGGERRFTRRREKWIATNPLRRDPLFAFLDGRTRMQDFRIALAEFVDVFDVDVFEIERAAVPRMNGETDVGKRRVAATRDFVEIEDDGRDTLSAAQRVMPTARLFLGKVVVTRPILAADAGI